MRERHYYRLPRITRVEAEFLRSFVQRTDSEPLRRVHLKFVDRLAYISYANDVIQKSRITSTEEKELSRNITIELEEELQADIEREGQLFLSELRQGRSEFFHDYDLAMKFFRFVAHQYFRTKRVREAIGRETSQLFIGYDFAKLKNIICYIAAENVGASLFVDRNDFGIVFLRSKSEARLITSDQPIVNLLGSGDSSPTEELAFYYPLSPNLACIISPKHYGLVSRDIPEETVEELNRLVAWKSNEFLVASSEETLQCFVSKLPLSRPQAHCIIDLLSSND